ncbi:MAG: GNAT family N-acetyltransferase, partial [Candidatus Hodarchaeota archaeon]
LCFFSKNILINMGVVEFEEIYVAEGYKRQGIGFSLVTYAIQTVKEYFKRIAIQPRRIYLFTSKDNKPARYLFEKCGFKSIGEVGNLFSDSQKEMIYSLTL